MCGNATRPGGLRRVSADNGGILEQRAKRKLPHQPRRPVAHKAGSNSTVRPLVAWVAKPTDAARRDTGEAEQRPASGPQRNSAIAAANGKQATALLDAHLRDHNLSTPGARICAIDIMHMRMQHRRSATEGVT